MYWLAWAVLLAVFGILSHRRNSVHRESGTMPPPYGFHHHKWMVAQYFALPLALCFAIVGVVDIVG